MKNKITFKMLNNKNEVEFVTFTPAEYVEVFEEDIDNVCYYLKDRDAFEDALVCMAQRQKDYTLAEFVAEYLKHANEDVFVNFVD